MIEGVIQSRRTPVIAGKFDFDAVLRGKPNCMNAAHFKLLAALLTVCAQVVVSASVPAHAQSSSSHTVRGQLSVSCEPENGADEGRYEYQLAGKTIPALSSECEPGNSTSYISIEQVFQAERSTTLLIIEGVSATSQNIRVLNIPNEGRASVVDAYGGDGYALVQKADGRFRLISPGGGFALSADRMSTWTCAVDIDFAHQSAHGALVVPFEPGLPESVCEVGVTELAL
ncbi:hypothetical protein [Novosphingobium clariflavum]|uniref:Uncharacterized protein n=1 Tax=Novosphingobium clariflavum TaxID=2029884 RepID=A0ABV6S1G2_9SPHN|nr:hypothetical protein [Novosphingobium clariflavum]